MNCKFKPSIVNHVASSTLIGEDTFVEELLLDEDLEIPFTETGDDLESQLEHCIASLFLKMQTILHISETALREVTEQINQIFLLSQPLLKGTILPVLRKYCGDVSETVVSEVISAVNVLMLVLVLMLMSNVFLKCTSNDALLSTSAKRESYALREFPIVMPVEYKINGSQTVVYFPILKMLHAMLSNENIMDKALSTEVGQSSDYTSYRHGSCFKEFFFIII